MGALDFRARTMIHREGTFPNRFSCSQQLQRSWMFIENVQNAPRTPLVWVQCAVEFYERERLTWHPAGVRRRKMLISIEHLTPLECGDFG